MPVPGLVWNVAETAAHLVAELKIYDGIVRGIVHPRDDTARLAGPRVAEPCAAATATHLTHFTERDVSRLADMLVPAVDDFLAAASCRDEDECIVTASGRAVTVSTMTTLLLGEQLVHALDIARAVRVPWAIGRADALQVIGGCMKVMPDYVDRDRAAGLRVAYELRFPDGLRYRLLIADGTATVTPAGGPVDCWIAADPAAYLLVSHGRVSQRSQILRGRIVVGGLKPWLGFAFGRLLTGP